MSERVQLRAGDRWPDPEGKTVRWRSGGRVTVNALIVEDMIETKLLLRWMLARKKVDKGTGSFRGHEEAWRNVVLHRNVRDRTEEEASEEALIMEELE